MKVVELRCLAFKEEDDSVTVSITVCGLTLAAAVLISDRMSQPTRDIVAAAVNETMTEDGDSVVQRDPGQPTH